MSTVRLIANYGLNLNVARRSTQCVAGGIPAIAGILPHWINSIPFRSRNVITDVMSFYLSH
jgi:hypothetical protein